MKRYFLAPIFFTLFACTESNPSSSSPEHIRPPQSQSTSATSTGASIEPVSALSAASDVIAPSGITQVQAMSGVTAPAIVYDERTPPDNETIIQWANLDSDASVESAIPFQLISGERALIAKISRFQGRNDMYGAYLVRPSAKDAQEISESVHSIQTIPKEDDPKNRIVIIKTGASGGGNESYRWSIVYFDDWKMVTLHELDFSNSAACFNFPGMGYSCTQNKVAWDFETDKSDLILKETVVHSESKDITACTIPANSTVTTYRIKGTELSIESSLKSSMSMDVDCPQKHQKKHK